MNNLESNVKKLQEQLKEATTLLEDMKKITENMQLQLNTFKKMIGELK